MCLTSKIQKQNFYPVINMMVVLIHLLAYFEPTVVYGQCIGENGTVCCEGYKWDGEKSRCVKCDVGYLGSECEMRCPYPSYGDACQKLCDCEKMNCNFVDGCSVTDTTIPSITIRQFVTVVVKEGKDESTKSLLFGLFGVNSIVVLAAAIYIIKCMLKKFRLRESNQSTIGSRHVEEITYESGETNVIYQDVNERPYTVPLSNEVQGVQNELQKSQTEVKSVDSIDSSGYLMPSVSIPRL